MKIRNLIAVLLAAPIFASAGTINLSDTQNITGNGQVFNFNFNNVGATSGTNGQLTIALNGDYSHDQSDEWAKFAMEDSGNLVLGVYSSWTNGIVSNGVSGLTLASRTLSPITNLDDTQTIWVFNLSNVLLNTLLSDNKLKIKVTDASQVHPYNYVDQDFIRVGLSFNTASVDSPAADIPEPASLALFGLGLAGLAGVARRRKPA